MRWRVWEERLALCAMRAAVWVVAASLLLIVGTVVLRGLPAMTLDMVTQTPRGGFYLGGEGGILNAIIGSLLIAGGATLLALLIGVPVALYLNVYRRRGSRLAWWIRLSLDVLWGIPSIVYGAFGFAVMLALGMRASLLAGTVTVTFLILPVMIRSVDEIMRMMPRELMEASYSLGATRWETAVRVCVRQTLPGIVSAILVAFGRGVGDAASVIFTAGFSDNIPTNLLQPAATLPLAVFFQLGTANPQVRERAYASALILTSVILVISLAARWLVRRYNRHVVR
jgi:phosphate transport system permease protein